MQEITVEELKEKMNNNEEFILLDVRRQDEFDLVNLDGVLIPLDQLESRFEELDSSKEIIVHCRSGKRSADAIMFLETKGFNNCKNLVGGILAWADRIDPSLPKY